MLERRLREDKHPAHAAELRENIVPATATLHGRSNCGLPSLTLFPHEDTLARTLEYELEVAKIRQSEVDAGNADPGRPLYLSGYGGQTGTPCRVHMPHHLSLGYAIFRFDPNDPRLYLPNACPGVGTSPIHMHFPIVSTLLSIPFAVMHQVPRLVSFSTLTPYQHAVLRVGVEIMRLWDWDPEVPSRSEPQGCGMAVASSAKDPDAFRGLSPIVTRTATLESIWSRIEEARRLCGHPASDGDSGKSDGDDGLGSGGDEDEDEDNDDMISDHDSDDESWLQDPDTQPFVGGTANDALMVSGNLDPGVYVAFLKIPPQADEVDGAPGMFCGDRYPEGAHVAK
ncbi:hypothetical protein B0H16DRAFT_1881577 [Mycena metata]|uniref:Uncharacterized protein n=1 Tax=Mycena metata TaxID=1033252 RepID=A0AAD7NQQ2_9AGAR|nr:hypothetical protein B0H16DRAFT_1881577 [Mycena metata]